MSTDTPRTDASRELRVFAALPEFENTTTSRVMLAAADHIDALERELAEQCRLNGMGSEREAMALGRIAELEREVARLREALLELAETSWTDVADGTAPELVLYRAWVLRTAAGALKETHAARTRHWYEHHQKSSEPRWLWGVGSAVCRDLRRRRLPVRADGMGRRMRGRNLRMGSWAESRHFLNPRRRTESNPHICLLDQAANRAGQAGKYGLHRFSAKPASGRAESAERCISIDPADPTPDKHRGGATGGGAMS